MNLISRNFSRILQSSRNTGRLVSTVKRPLASPPSRHLHWYSGTSAAKDLGLRISERAIQRLKEVDPQPILRVAVDSGGCNGYQYVMELVKETEPEDV